MLLLFLLSFLLAEADDDGESMDRRGARASRSAAFGEDDEDDDLPNPSPLLLLLLLLLLDFFPSFLSAKRAVHELVDEWIDGEVDVG